jgi:hypothetical protein
MYARTYLRLRSGQARSGGSEDKEKREPAHHQTGETPSSIFFDI